MNVQEANAEDLQVAYYRGTRAHVAARRLCDEIAGGNRAGLARLLRDYRDRPITSADEIEVRAAVDDLLIYCDVLEIATLGGFITPPDKSEHWTMLGTLLSNAFLRSYYADYYPLKLPQLLIRRIRGEHMIIESDSAALSAVMIQFLALDRRFMATLNDKCFLRMLDSFQIQGYWLSDIVHLIGDPREFVRRILVPEENRETPDQALHEFSAFVQFSLDLDRLLSQVSDYPLVRSEMWNHYGYWFGILGERLREDLGGALDQFLRWEPVGKADDVAREIQEGIDEARGAFNRLTSELYSSPVDAVLNDSPR